MMQVDPEAYFRDNNLNESAVLRISHFVDRGQFEIVLAYADINRLMALMRDQNVWREETGRIQEGKRIPTSEFRRLLFDNVADLVRTNIGYRAGFKGWDPNYKGFDPNNINFAPGDPFTFVIQGIRVERRGDFYDFAIGLSEFGVCQFHLGRLLVSHRVAVSIPTAHGVQWFDSDTGEIVDPSDPFHDNDYVATTIV